MRAYTTHYAGKVRYDKRREMEFWEGEKDWLEKNETEEEGVVKETRSCGGRQSEGCGRWDEGKGKSGGSRGSV